jgi:hypothetical protein
MHGTRSGGSALAPGFAALQLSAAERTANVQAVGAAVPRARRIPLPKASELTQLDIKVPSVNLTPRGCLTKSKCNDALAHSIADDGTRARLGGPPEPPVGLFGALFGEIWAKFGIWEGRNA